MENALGEATRHAFTARGQSIRGNVERLTKSDHINPVLRTFAKPGFQSTALAGKTVIYQLFLGFFPHWEGAGIGLCCNVQPPPESMAGRKSGMLKSPSPFLRTQEEA